MDVSTVWDFCGELVGSIRPRKGFVPATVTRIDNDGTVWVTTGDGGEAPASTCAAGVAVGDVVSVQWSGAQMGVVGNASDPAAGTSTVRAVRKATDSAAKVASGAQAIADAIKQHFFTDDNGVHVSSEKGNPTGERNILMNSLGILLRQGSSWLASFSDSAVAFYDGLGNAAANVVAQFGADGAVIGRSSESHMELDYHSQRMIDRDGNEFFKVEDLRDESGTLEVTDTFESDGESRVYVLTYTATGTDYTVTVSDGSGGSVTKQTTKITFDTYPTVGAIITVTYTTASELTKSYTFGKRDATADVGAMSVAEGLETAASGRQSHASGYLTTASGANAYAGGARTTATGRNSRATGEDTTASGWGSRADGLHTIAGSDYQTAIGKWNDNDPNNAFEVGNGVAGARSNAFAVGWDGSTTHDGDVAWTALTLDSGATAYDANRTPKVRRWGPVVALTGAAKPTAEVAAGGTLTICTLPDGCRPAQEVTSLQQGSGDACWLLRITTAGVVTAERHRNRTGNTAMGTSEWLPLNVTFMV